MKHTGERRTDDGIDPLEVAGGGKNFAPKIQEILFSSAGGRNPAPPL